MSHLLPPFSRLLPPSLAFLQPSPTFSDAPRALFEYTKDNNVKGINIELPIPSGGWREHTWHSFRIPITEAMYSFPASTPWDDMDRLELYYAYPHHLQPRGDYVRLRNVYVRSTRSFSALQGAGADTGGVGISKDASRDCRQLELADKMRHVQAESQTPEQVGGGWQRSRRLGQSLGHSLRLSADRGWLAESRASVTRQRMIDLRNGVGGALAEIETGDLSGGGDADANSRARRHGWTYTSRLVGKLLPGVVACAIMLGLIWCAIMVLQRGGFCRVSSASLSGYSEYMRIEAKTKD